MLSETNLIYSTTIYPNQLSKATYLHFSVTLIQGEKNVVTSSHRKHFDVSNN